MTDDMRARVEAAVRDNYVSNANLEGRRALGAYAVSNDRGAFVFSHFDWPGDASVLDIGCGDGIWTTAAARETPRGRVIGLDYSAGMLAKLRERAPTVWPVHGDAHSLPVATDAFDVVLAMFMLYHVDVRRTLPECLRALRPGGRFFAATTGAELLPTFGDLLQSAANEIAGGTLAEYWVGSMPFSSENGAEILAPYFTTVDRAVNDTEYEVPIAAPLVGYVASLRGPALARLGDQFDFDAFLTLVERRIDERLATGPARFSRRMAVFTCHP